MSSVRRHSAFEFSLHASGAIIALLALAATVSAGAAQNGAPAAIASMLVVTSDAEAHAEGAPASPAGRRIWLARAAEGPSAGTSLTRVRLGAWMLNIPPPAGA